MSLNYHLCKFIFNFPFIAEYHYEFSAFKFDSIKMGNILSNDQSNPRQCVQIVCFSQTRNPNQWPKISTSKIFINNNKKNTKKSNVSHLIHTSAKDKVSFLIPLECKYRAFMLTQSTGQVTWKKITKCHLERDQGQTPEMLRCRRCQSLTVFCPYPSKAIIWAGC